jgi:outer membrane immunogenic protein
MPFIPTKAPPVVVYNWSGLYVGGNIGGAWGSFNSDPFGFAATPALFSSFFFAGVPNVGFEGSASTSFVGGGQLGYNWQLGHFVIGFEGDAQGTALQQSVTSQMFTTCGVAACTSTPGTVTARDLVQGSLRARLGYAIDRWLVYGTGGWATADMQIDSAAAATPSVAFRVPTSSNTEILNGWTLGAGFAYAVTDAISVGAEYRHTDFGHAQFPVFAGATTGGFTGVAPLAVFSVGGNAINAGMVQDQVTARVNMKLGNMFDPRVVTW